MSAEVVSHHLATQELYQLAQCLQVTVTCIILQQPFTCFTATWWFII